MGKSKKGLIWYALSSKLILVALLKAAASVKF